MERLLPWLVRGLWAGLPFTSGPALAAALDSASRPVQIVASTLLWLGWAVGMVATFAPHPLALTALRVVAPAAVVAALAASVADEPSALAVVWSAVACAWAFAPAIGSLCVNGPAYPNERRFLLRPPGPLLAGPLPLAWALSVAGIVAGPLLLAARQWVLGGLLLLVGWPLAVLLLKSIHNLSRRWAVFVPAGVVLHDPVVLFDPTLFRRRDVVGFRAGRNPDYYDLSQRAPGLGIELELDEVTTVTLQKPGRREGAAIHAKGLRFTPTRPGAVLEEARRRRLAR
ncbi:MAG TPA: hypothetical protein VM388_12235 [Acidimicrobiales bacterium]|nr:hypothetical protein [Acidimicrobiales bacterium]